MPRTKRGEVEHSVLLALSTQEATSSTALCQMLPHLKSGSVASALAFLTAERSVRRVKRGVYCLTEKGLARRDSGLVKRAVDEPKAS